MTETSRSGCGGVSREAEDQSDSWINFETIFDDEEEENEDEPDYHHAHAQVLQSQDQQLLGGGFCVGPRAKAINHHFQYAGMSMPRVGPLAESGGTLPLMPRPNTSERVPTSTAASSVVTMGNTTAVPDDDGCVNVYVVVDPQNDTVYCPPQLMSYQRGFNTHCTMFDGALLSTLNYLQDRHETTHISSSSHVIDSSHPEGTASSSFAKSSTENPSWRYGIVPPPIIHTNPVSRSRQLHPLTYSQQHPAISSNEQALSFWSTGHAPMSPPSLAPIIPSNTPSSVSSISAISSLSLPSPVPTTTTTIGATTLPPLRALSAYNFFFQDERTRILHGGPLDLTLAKEDALLREHWNRNRDVKRRHRKSHGKIDFTTLSKLISSRWKTLDAAGKDFYRRMAMRDWHRYRSEQDAYNLLYPTNLPPTPLPDCSDTPSNGEQ